ncbi:HEPN domain-containing protein [Xanthocytophaga agilis]|uniref:HEPN domain-containing protein n=1 Tax=Xanthocytophaga agilis TaxID=3048010 RepID=A0AAE3RBJ8_9BACT|nr:HEPN domain-containing protein [Xanthocytophaga agilis]MDJ1505210.1 HEPN domain-containing protein [Xanthocytophaga agilis]
MLTVSRYSIVQNTKSFVFLGDWIDAKQLVPLQLFDHYQLVKASKVQIEYIKRQIDYLLLANVPNIWTNKFEIERVPTSNGVLYQGVPEAKWNYYVIEHKRRQAGNSLKLALTLSSLDLTVLFEVYFDQNNDISTRHIPNYLMDGLSTFNYTYDTSSPFYFYQQGPKIIDNKGIEELNFIYQKCINFKHKPAFDFIQKALKDFLEVKSISDSSAFKILSYFSILELVLTTNQNRTPGGVSLTHQLQKKMSLLNNRFSEPIDFQKHFKTPNTVNWDKLIEKLYDYRSSIAHGTQADFSDKLSMLKDRYKVLDFVKELCRKVLLQALIEPQLITDLKQC